MRHGLLCVLIMQFCWVFPLPADDFWQQLDAPWGGQVSSLLVLQNNDILVSLYKQGIFFSKDEGIHWFPGSTDMAEKIVTDMVQLINGYIIAATLDSGLYISKDQTATWQPAMAGITGTIWFESLAVAPDKTVYAGSWDAGVFKSNDSGEHWEPSSTGLPTTRIKHLIVISDGTVFAGTYDKGIYRLRNSTEGWVSISAGLNDMDIYLLNAAKNDTLYASTWAGGLFSSGDFGDHWKRVQQGQVSGSFNNFVQDSRGTCYIADNYYGTYILQPETTNWQMLQEQPASRDVIALAVTQNGTLLAGTYSSAIFRKEKDKVWQWSSYGLAYSHPYCLLYHEAGKCFFTAVTGMEVLRSKDDGSTWEKLTNGLNLQYCETMVIDKKDYVYAGSTSFGIFRSSDVGDSWKAVNNGLGSLYINTLFENPITGTLLAGQDDGFLDRSTNSGDTWLPSNAGLTNEDVSCFAVSTDNRIYAATEKGVVYSIDDGKSWQPLTMPMGSVSVQCLALTGKNHIYIGTNGFGLLRSKDNGLTWEDLNPVVPGSFIYGLLVDDLDRVYAAPARMDIYRSDSEGENWQNITSGMGKVEVSFMTILNDYIYVGTFFRGLYRSTDPVTSVGPLAFTPVEKFCLEQNFPNPFNPTTSIQYHLAEFENVQLEIFDLTGRHVRTLISGQQPAGSHVVLWDTCNDAGGQVASGVYMYCLRTSSSTVTRKMVVVR